MRHLIIYWHFIITSPITVTFIQSLQDLISSAKIYLSVAAASGWVALDYLLHADPVSLLLLIMCVIITMRDINIVGLNSQELTLYKTKVIETRLCGCSV